MTTKKMPSNNLKNVVNYSMLNELVGGKRLNKENRNKTFIDTREVDPRLPQRITSFPPAPLNYDDDDDYYSSTSYSSSLLNNFQLFKIHERKQFKSVFNSPHLTSKLPCILKEHEFDLSGSNLNKIFCSQWLDNRVAILGTKCNKIVILDTITGKFTIKDPVKSHPNSQQIENHCGIHSIAINPSRTLLATGAEHVNDLAVYTLPDLEPHSVGYNAHSYWIFDIVWLDDDHVVTGAGDNRLALWRINTNKNSNTSSYHNPSIYKGSSPSKTTSSHLNTLPLYNGSSRCMSNRFYEDDDRSRLHLKRTLSSSPYVPHNYNTRLSNLGQRCIHTSSSRRLANQIIYISPDSATTSSSNRHLQCNPTPSTTTAAVAAAASSSSTSPSSSSPSSSGRLSRVSSGRITYIHHHLNTDQDNYDESSSSSSDSSDSEESGDNLEESNNFLDRSYDYTSNSQSTSTNNMHQSSIQHENDEEDEDDDEDDSYKFQDAANQNDGDYDDIADNDDDDDDNDSSFIKRRRLNSKCNYSNGCPGGMTYNQPIKSIKCKQSMRIRALAFNPKRNEIVAISMNAAFHYFDIQRFEQKYTKKLSPLKENVCLTINEDYSIYAIGSASHVQLLDASNARLLTSNPIFIKHDIGVRSVHFRNNILSIGTGIGTILFYDLRTHRFLKYSDYGIDYQARPTQTRQSANNTTTNNYHENGINTTSSSTIDSENQVSMQTHGGWLLRNETYYEHLPYGFNGDNSHAIYSHSYDPSGTKMLTVGGPLTINLYGHYAAIWQ